MWYPKSKLDMEAIKTWGNEGSHPTSNPSPPSFSSNDLLFLLSGNPWLSSQFHKIQNHKTKQ